MSRDEMDHRGWKVLDVILISGDAYVDHPSYGTAVIGRILEKEGYSVGIIAQPDWRTDESFLQLGSPRLFFGITGGNIDSMVANYTANKRRRRSDAYSPGGLAGLRPDRASIVYANKVRQIFGDIPIVLGGIEASLRRFAHYDWWDDGVRRSIIVDSRADILVYGMGERQIREIARRLRSGADLGGIRGTVIVTKEKDRFPDVVEIPSFDDVKRDKDQFCEAFRTAYAHHDPFRGKITVQKHDTRYVCQFPPPPPLSPDELDSVYDLPYLRAWHPSYNDRGGVPGFETVRNSIISHRGCCGECNFCSLSMHQGRIVQSRSEKSIIREAQCMASDPSFRGTISDIGGPTANLYGASCVRWTEGGPCEKRHCLTPQPCPHLKTGLARALGMLFAVHNLARVKHVFVESGIRYDLCRSAEGQAYLRGLCNRHVSGQMKVAPEHCSPVVLRTMNKPGFEIYEEFLSQFRHINADLNRKQFVVNYFISAHPGSTLENALELALYLARQRIRPEQVQDYTPLPMTVSATMFHTGKNPFTGKDVYTAKTMKERRLQRALIQYGDPKNRNLVREALRLLKKESLTGILLPLTRKGAPHGPRKG